jgi:hypothetical protein
VLVHRRLAAVVLSSLTLSACASAGAGAPRSGAGGPSPTPPSNPADHIVVIVMENHEASSILGSSDAPYLNRLARRNVLLTSDYAIRHPSLPNYLALIGGSTFGVTSDCTDCSVDAGNLVDQLERKQISWKAYMESMPHACYTGSFAGTAPNEYAKKHDPFMYFDDVRTDEKRCAKIVPFGRLSRDLKRGLPQFAWITPNECHDMHSCSVSTGDAWLKTWVPKIIRALGTDGILLLLFDEGSSDASCCSLPTGGGHVLAIIAGPGAKQRTKIEADVDHYSVLRLIEDEWGLKRLRHAGDDTTPSIEGWRGP